MTLAVRAGIIVEQEGKFADSKDIMKQASTKFWEIVIMRRHVVSIAILLLVTMASGTAPAKDEKPNRKAKSPLSVQPVARKAPEELGRRKRVGSTEAEAGRRRDREEMARGMLRTEQLRKLDKQLEESRGRHNRFVGELKAIKELALQEKAEKTAKRLQELIDKSTGRFDEDVRKLEQRRDRIREQVEKQAKGRLRHRGRLMERRKEEQEKARPQGKTGEGKAKGEGKGRGQGRGKRRSEGETEP